MEMSKTNLYVILLICGKRVLGLMADWGRALLSGICPCECKCEWLLVVSSVVNQRPVHGTPLLAPAACGPVEHTWLYMEV